MLQIDNVQASGLNALYWDLAVPPHTVKVEVENGWVTMSGTVDRPYQRACAESDAAGFLVWSASPIRFGSRRRMRSKGPLGARVRCKWAPEIAMPRANYCTLMKSGASLASRARGFGRAPPPRGRKAQKLSHSFNPEADSRGPSTRSALRSPRVQDGRTRYSP